MSWSSFAHACAGVLNLSKSLFVGNYVKCGFTNSKVLAYQLIIHMFCISFITIEHSSGVIGKCKNE